jgi:hypothetical protein
MKVTTVVLNCISLAIEIEFEKSGFTACDNSHYHF